MLLLQSRPFCLTTPGSRSFSSVFSHVEDSKYYLLRESPSLGVAEHGSGASLDVAREVRSRVLVRNFSQVSQGALFVVSVTAYVNKSVSWQGIVNLPG